MFTPEEKQKVREATDLVQLVGETVALRQRGHDMWGCCPFHHEKSPSFHVMPDRGFWKCFSCGKGGDCFNFVMERDHVEFPEAVRILADRAGIVLSDDGSSYKRDPNATQKGRLYEVVQAAAEFYHAQLTRSRTPAAAAARDYLGHRGFGSAVAQNWTLGYAPGMGALSRHLSSLGFSPREMVDANLAIRRDDGTLADRFYNRVMFLIRDERGRAVGFGGRVLDDSKPKYLNTSDTAVFHKKANHFALERAKASITANLEAIVMEGYTDVISSHEAGITNCVAPLGTSFTSQQVKMLSRYLTPAGERLSRGRIVCLFDGDEAGLKAAERAMQYVTTTTAGMYCVVLPGGMDPAEYIAAQGVQAMRDRIAERVPLVRFVIDRHLDRFDISTPEARALALADVVGAMGPIKGSVLADEYVDYVAGRLLADVSTVRAALANVRWVAPREDDSDEAPLISVRQQSFDVRDPEPSYEHVQPAPVVPLLPEDARALQLERELLSALAADVRVAKCYADRVAQLTWRDPSHEAIAWAIMAVQDDATPLQVLDDAEAVCPGAAQILASGAREIEADKSACAVEVLLDDIEARELRRAIEAGRSELRTIDPQDTTTLRDKMAALSDLQQRLMQLEDRRRKRN